MVPDNREIANLLQRIQAQDERAMRTLYVAFNRRVYAFALNRLNDPAESEQVVLDTMLEVWKNPNRFRGDSAFATWLLGIARHKVLDTLRARPALHDEIDDEAMHVPSPAADGFDLLLLQQRKELVHRCMSRLPDEQRECLHLVFFEGLPLQDIARVQSCPENTIKTRLFHARAKMKTCLSRLLRND